LNKGNPYKESPNHQIIKKREKRTNIHEKRSMTQSLKTIRRKEGKQTKYLLITFFVRGGQSLFFYSFFLLQQKTTPFEAFFCLYKDVFF